MTRLVEGTKGVLSEPLITHLTLVTKPVSRLVAKGKTQLTIHQPAHLALTDKVEFTMNFMKFYEIHY